MNKPNPFVDILMLVLLLTVVFSGGPLIIAILFPILTIGVISLGLLRLARWAERQ